MNSNFFPQSFQSAILSLPSKLPGGPKRTCLCLFEGLDGQRLTLECSERPPVSAAVSVEHDDAMFLCEIVAVAPRANGKWHAELRVEQVLSGLQSLMKLREHLLGEGTAAAPERRPAYVGVYA